MSIEWELPSFQVVLDFRDTLASQDSSKLSVLSKQEPLYTPTRRKQTSPRKMCSSSTGCSLLPAPKQSSPTLSSVSVCSSSPQKKQICRRFTPREGLEEIRSAVRLVTRLTLVDTKMLSTSKVRHFGKTRGQQPTQCGRLAGSRTYGPETCASPTTPPCSFLTASRPKVR